MILSKVQHVGLRPDSGAPESLLPGLVMSVHRTLKSETFSEQMSLCA